MDAKATGKGQLRTAPRRSVKANKNMLGAYSKQRFSHAITVQEMTSREFQGDIYAHIDVAKQYLKDQATIRYFQSVIALNKHLFKGKTVIDVGCGTGILSLFAAKAGAARVFAVDSSNVVDYTRKIVADNKYSNVIEIIHGRIEDIVLPVEQVDIIVCDWMGYSLLYQSACEAVIFARDKWLRRDPPGLIFPDVAKLFIAGFQDPVRKNEKIEWWKNVYGVNMKCLREFSLKEPCFCTVQPEQILTTDFNVKTLNLYTDTIKDMGFRTLFSLRMLRAGLIDGIVSYFQVRFSKSHTPFMFSTDPWSPNTHWMQSTFFFDQPVSGQLDEIICGGLEMEPADRENPNLNNIDVALELCCGEPMQLQVDMLWQMKPAVPIVTSSTASTISNTPPQCQKTVDNNNEKPPPALTTTQKHSSHKKNTTPRQKKKQKNLKKDVTYTF